MHTFDPPSRFVRKQMAPSSTQKCLSNNHLEATRQSKHIAEVRAIYNQHIGQIILHRNRIKGEMQSLDQLGYSEDFFVRFWGSSKLKASAT